MPDTSPAVATDEQSTDDLVASLGWDISAEEQVLVDEIDAERDLLDVDLRNDDSQSDSDPALKPDVDAPVVVKEEVPAADLADPTETELTKYKREQEVSRVTAQQDSEVAGQIAQMAKEYRDRLVTEDWSTEAANQMATQAGENAWSKYQAYKAETALTVNQKATMDAELGAKYKIDPSLISTFPDQASKEKAAIFLGATVSAATATAKQPIAKAPVQTNDGGAGSPGAANNKEQRKADYSTGRTDLTRAEFKDLFGYWP